MYRFTFENGEAKMNRDFRLKKRDYLEMKEEERLELEKEIQELTEQKDESFGTNENDLRLLWETVQKSRMETSYKSDYCVTSITKNRIPTMSLKEKIPPKSLKDKIKEEKIVQEENENK